MQLYQFSGKEELFPDTGLLLIPNKVSGNLTELINYAKKHIITLKKQNKAYNLYIHKLEIREFNKQLVIHLLEEEFVDIVIESKECLNTWKSSKKDL